MFDAELITLYRIRIVRAVMKMLYDPEVARQYADIALQKICTLIKYALWDNVTLERFNRWKRQFITEEDRYFSTYLAYQLLFYNNKDFLTLISWAYAEVIRQLVLNRYPALEFNDEIWLQKLKEEEEKVLICPFAVDTPAASGNMITRLLRNQNLISESRLCSVEQLTEKLDSGRFSTVVFIDDMIGSGDQARDFMLTLRKIGDQNISIRNLLLRCEIQGYLAIGLAPFDSIRNVQRQTGLTVITAETLTEKNSTTNNSFWFPEDVEDAKAFLRHLAEHYRIPRVGHSEGAWAVAFEHGVPDVSSPFYYYENENWVSLIPRRGVEL